MYDTCPYKVWISGTLKSKSNNVCFDVIQVHITLGTFELIIEFYLKSYFLVYHKCTYMRLRI